MNQEYEEYCLADPLFYDSCIVTRGDDVDFPLADRPVPEGWTRTEVDDWLVYRHSDGATLPTQGWKIHVSACLDNAQETLAIVVDYCTSRRITFKFIRSLQHLLLRNSKYSDRSASGKFITIYPADEAQLESMLVDLGALLQGRAGPYILSDLRWGDGPLFVRYGGFAERYCVGPDGEPELAILDDTGRLVPDHRGPTFSPPSWVTLPAFLEAHLAARASATMADLPYRLERAIHFSNAGGLYVGVDERTGDAVVLKEARPHAGLDTDGTDAVARLNHERQMLERLAGLDVVPTVRDHFMVADHHFLVLDFIEGEPLNAVVGDRFPLMTDRIDDNDIARYTAWATGMCTALENAVAAIHQRGVVFRDLHPDNVIVRPDGSIALVDLEIAADVENARRQALADPGFVAPAGCTGLDIDRYALACIRIWMFLPLTNLFAIDRGKAGHLARAIAELFPVAPGYLDAAERTICDAPPSARATPGQEIWNALEPDVEGWHRARASMVSAILASATPDRSDRLFPGDIEQFETGGLNLAHGAAGVLFAMAETGGGRHEDHEEWLVQRATHPEPGAKKGFYDGLHGVAYVLDRLGHAAEARKIVDMCVDDLHATQGTIGLDLYGGLSGMALNLAHFGSRYDDPVLGELALKLAGEVADRLGDEESVSTTSGGDHPYAGLLRGSAGPALMFIRLFEASGDTALLDLAATALRQDLRRCVESEGGALEVNEDWRTMPYLADGSVGIGMVLDDYLGHRHDERFAEAAAAIRRAACGSFFIQPGLFYGRAGMILHLARGRSSGAAAGDEAAIATHVRRLAWHALAYRGHLAFPGEQLLRLSMDLATGTAGVLLAVGSALHDSPVHLPFLGPARGNPATGATTSEHTPRGGD